MGTTILLARRRMALMVVYHTLVCGALLSIMGFLESTLRFTLR